MEKNAIECNAIQCSIINYYYLCVRSATFSVVVTKFGSSLPRSSLKTVSLSFVVSKASRKVRPLVRKISKALSCMEK